MSDWLIRKSFAMHSGGMGDFKIECGALTDEELEAFALLISKRFIFSAVHGVSRVGFPIASALQKYCTRAAEARLIVDDVLTTGLAMEMARKNQADIGIVLFARGPCPDWVWPVFQLWYSEC
jgi:hypothetical protein